MSQLNLLLDFEEMGGQEAEPMRKFGRDSDIEFVQRLTSDKMLSSDHETFRLKQLEKRASTKNFKREQLSSMIQQKPVGAKDKKSSLIQRS